MLARESTVQVRSNRQRHRPWALFGGKGGAPGRCIKNPGNGEIRLPSKFVQTFNEGDVFRVGMPGSGGYGDLFERDPSAVAKDVVGEKITLDHACREYGVVIDPETLRVDDAATRAERQNPCRQGAAPESCGAAPAAARSGLVMSRPLRSWRIAAPVRRNGPPLSGERSPPVKGEARGPSDREGPWNQGSTGAPMPASWRIEDMRRIST